MLVHGLCAGQVYANRVMCRQDVAAVLNPAHAIKVVQAACARSLAQKHIKCLVEWLY